MTEADGVRVHGQGPELAIVDGEGSAHALVWPAVGATARAMYRIRLAAGAQTIELRHRGEAVYGVLAGDGTVHDGSGTTQVLITGSMAHVDPGTPYRFTAGAEGLDLVGGPGPADLPADVALAH